MPNFELSEKIGKANTKYGKFCCHLIALILVLYNVKGLRITKNVKEIKFEGVLGELESKKSFQRQ